MQRLDMPASGALSAVPVAIKATCQLSTAALVRLQMGFVCRDRDCWPSPQGRL